MVRIRTLEKAINIALLSSLKFSGKRHGRGEQEVLVDETFSPHSGSRREKKCLKVGKDIYNVLFHFLFYHI